MARKSTFALLLAVLPVADAVGATPISITLSSSLNPSVIGRQIILSAALSTPAGTGQVTFYDGVIILGVGRIANGEATLATSLLPAGTHSLKAYYAGDTVYAPCTSVPWLQTVVVASANTFQGASNYSAGSGPFSITTGDFNSDGNADLAVANETGGNITILLGNGDGSFRSAGNYSAGSGPDCIVSGDFNGDGKPDLAVSNRSGTNGVSVLLGNGDGTFHSPVNYSAGESAVSIVLGDFNTDGKVDLAVASAQGISVLLGNGDGTFQAAVNWSPYPGPLSVGDFNGDDKADLVVAGTNGVSVLLGNGDGTFQAPIPSVAASNGLNIAVGDFNRDGRADVAITNQQGYVAVLLGNGDGTFNAGVTFATGFEAWFVAIGDFNGDGISDLAVANEGTNTISVLLGNSDGTFQSAIPYGTGSTPVSLAVGDFNGDGKTDLMVANEGSGNVSALLGRLAVQSTTVLSSSNPAVYGQTVVLSAAISPSVATGTVTFYEGKTALGSAQLSGGNAILSLSTFSAGSHLLSAVYSGDATYATSSSSQLTLTVNQASTTTTVTSSVNPSAYGQSVMLRAAVLPLTASGTVSFNDGSTSLGSSSLANGAAYLAVPALSMGSHSLGATYTGNTNYASSSSVTLTQIVNKGTTATSVISSANPSRQLQTVTLSASVSPSSATGSITFLDGSTTLENRSLSGGITSLSISTLSPGTHSISAVYSGDNTYLTSTSASLSQIVNTATITKTTLTTSTNPAALGQPLTLTAQIFPPSGTGSITFYDGVSILGIQPVANGLAVLTTSLIQSGMRSLKAYYSGDNANTQSTSAWLQQPINAAPGYGFLTPSSYATGTDPSSIFVADFNGDGYADLCVANEDNTVSVFLGKGDGTFTPVPNSIHGMAIAVGDFNGDGRMDIAVYEFLNSTPFHVPEGNISVFFGNGDGTFRTSQTNTDIIGSIGYVSTADFNGDGRADLAMSEITQQIPCTGPCGGVTIYLGNGDGTFKPGNGVSDYGLSSFVVGDFNGDGNVDLATYSPSDPGSGSSGGLNVYLGNGDGTFQPPVASPLAGVPVVAADVNGDGKLDVVAASSVLLGNGDGTFQSPIAYSGGANSMSAGDFNGDGKLDLAAVSVNNLQIMLGNGDGTFQPPVIYNAGKSLTFLGVSDFNGDSRLDVAVISSSGNNLDVLLAAAAPRVVPSAISIVSGNNQTGTAGFALSQNLVARVLGSDGSPVAGALVTFAVVSGNASVNPTTVTSDSAGMAATSVTLGTTAGAIQVSASVPGIPSVTFSATSLPVAASLSIVGGNNQTGTIGTSLGQQLVVRVAGSDGSPSAGATVTFAVASGSALVNPVTVVSGTDGTAATSVSLGSTPGPIQIMASVAGLPTVTFSATSVANAPAPQIDVDGVMSAGLSSPPLQVASPNATFSIFGQNFAPLGTNRRVLPPDFINSLMPTNLAGVCVLFGGQRAPIFLVTPWQLNVQVPQVTYPSTVIVQVITDCDTPTQMSSNQITLPTQATAPEFFYAAQDGSDTSPVSAIDGLTNSQIGDPARLGPGYSLAYPGEVVTIYATGFGLTTPAFATGELATTGAQITGMTVMIDGIAVDPSTIQYAGVVIGAAGLYQLNLVLPSGLAPGDHTIVMSINGASSPSSAYISVGLQETL